MQTKQFFNYDLIVRAIQSYIIKSLYLCYFRQINRNKSLIIHDQHTLLGFIVLKYFLKNLFVIIRFTLFKFILRYHYHYHYHYQILILISYQYNSQFLYFLLHIYILLKIFGGDTFHMHKEQNLKLLMINIVVFFLLVFFGPFLS